MAAKNEKKQRAKRKEVSPLPSSKRGIRIKGPKDVVRLLNRLINEVLTASDEDREATESRLRVVAYAMTNMLKAYEIGDLGERIGKLEEHVVCFQSKVGSRN